jgi:hypothetical protein
MHPGWADTPGISAALPGFYGLMGPILRTPAQGADTIVWLAADLAPAGISGWLFLDRRARPFDRLPSTRTSPADRELLFDIVAELARTASPVASRAGRRPTPLTDGQPHGAIS